MLVHHRLEAVVGGHRGQRGVVGRGNGAVHGGAVVASSAAKALALICMLYRSSVPADCCTSPGMEPSKASEVQLRDSPGGTEKSRHAVLQTPCEGVPKRCQ